MGEGLKQGELALKGIGVSSGIVAGRAQVLVHDTRDLVARRVIGINEASAEVERFRRALEETRRQLRHIRQRVAEALGEEHAEIFDAHLLAVEDHALINEVEHSIRRERLNVEPVLQRAMNRYADALARLKDSYLAERAADIRDVARRMLANLAGETLKRPAQISEACVAVAHDLLPSDTADLDRRFVQAFLTDLGSASSHTAIMARALSIPAVVGLHNVTALIRSGDTVLVDGSKGLVFIRPTQERLERFRRRARDQELLLQGLVTLRDKPPETLDGYHVSLSANIELIEELEGVEAGGACGIGLYRTEFLFLGTDKLPGEQAQYEAYARAAASQKPAPVVIRTLDLGADKLPEGLDYGREANPFMGDRAIRFCLGQPALFKTQLRAVLRAGAHGNVRLMYPMVSSAEEVIEANALLRECMDELESEGIPVNRSMEVGTMIEVPSAALVADLIAPHVSFFSLGTNDLIQYTMAADRGNENVAHLYRPTHPAVLRLIDHLAGVCRRHGQWSCVCGQMAADPHLVPLLVGLGVDELSVSPAQAPLIKDVIRKLHYSAAVELAQQALAEPSAGQIEMLCRRMIAGIAPEVIELDNT